MLNRRRFIQLGSLSTALISTNSFAGSMKPSKGPIVLSTWAPNIKANKAAWEILSEGGYALDAVVAGVMVPEADPTDNSVGYGGLPDRDGKVTVDSCVMNEKGQCGAVMGLEEILHPVQVARMVMEQTPHIQLVGDGALQFAISKGLKRTNLLTEQSEKAWRNWLKTANYDPLRSMKELEEKIQREGYNKQEAMLYKWPSELLNHDTIGMIAMDAKGNLCGACSTSGMAFKMHGRVGDSPIIGAGLFIDNEVGAATATGIGEEIVKICGSHTIVEMMRHGASPEAACKEAVRRIIKNNGVNAHTVQAGFIAINKKGQYGGYSVMKNFSMALRTASTETSVNVKSWFS